MVRAPGLSVRLKLTLSYAGFLMLAGAVLLVVGYFSLSRGVHPGVVFMVRSHADLWRAFAPTAAIVMAFLLVFGLLGGWLLAGHMLDPLTRITDATRVAANGSLSHRIELEGRQDEFRELADSFDAMLARLEAHVAEQQRFAANASHETEDEQERQHDGSRRSERAPQGAVAFHHEDHTRVDTARKGEVPDHEQHGTDQHEEADVAEGELEASAQSGRSSHGLLPHALSPVACRCGIRRRPRWR